MTKLRKKVKPSKKILKLRRIVLLGRKASIITKKYLLSKRVRNGFKLLNYQIKLLALTNLMKTKIYNKIVE